MPATLTIGCQPKKSSRSNFKYLRIEKKRRPIVFGYSIINAVVKGEHGQRFQQYPRLMTKLESFDTDTKKKAAVFETVYL